MKLFNRNKRCIVTNYFLLVKENIAIFSFLVIFTAISTIFIVLSSDLLVNGHDSFVFAGKDFSLMPCDSNCISNRVIPLEQELNNPSNRISIFNCFIDLFQKDNSKHKYFPSYFHSLGPQYKHNMFVLIISRDHLLVSRVAEEVMTYNKHLILESYNDTLIDLCNDLCNIVLEYKSSINA